MSTPRENNVAPEGVVLPALGPKTCLQTVPRRYEETKLMINQEFTHRKIIDLGKHLHRETLRKCQTEKLEAIRTTEEALKAKAEIEKQQAIEEVAKRAQYEHEKTIRKLQKEHRKAILEEAVRVQGEMQVQANEAVKRAKDEGERKLQQAVQEIEEKLNTLHIQKENEAREEERAAAANEAEKVARQNREKFEESMKTAKEQKETAVADVKALCQREKEFAVAHARSWEQIQSAKKITDLKHSYEEKINEVKQYVAALKDILDSTRSSLSAEEALTVSLVRELLETREEFQKFINRTKPFCPGESDYLIPPVRSVDITHFLEKFSAQ